MSVSTKPIWSEAPRLPASGRTLQQDVTCDVCILGGGIAGLSVAYQLTRAGKRVAVLEAKSQVGAGETGYTSAHLASVLDDRFSRLESIRGQDAVHAAHASHATAIDEIESTVRRERIECDFQRVEGFLFAEDEDGEKLLHEEARVCEAARIRFDWCDHLPWPGMKLGPALVFPDQAQFQPRKYLVGLAAAVTSQGGEIYTGTRGDHIENHGSLRVVTSEGREVQAGSIVLATNTPINSGVAINAKIASYSTYVIAAEVPTSDAPPGLYWDTEDPYHFVRFHAMENDAMFVLVGGEDHKTGQAADQAARYDRLEVWARERFPRLGPVRYRWDGEVFETLDGLALIGPDHSAGKDIYVVTGDSGMGLTHGTLAGRIVTDAILGRDNPWADLYRPSRLPLAAAGTLLRENVNMAGQYFDWLTAGEGREAASLAPGEGTIIRRGLVKLAICRSEEDELHVLSATCPHLGGIVHWNAADQTWDCPCHGSKFAADGQLLHGPATTDLKAASLEPTEERLAEV